MTAEATDRPEDRVYGYIARKSYDLAARKAHRLDSNRETREREEKT